MSTTSVVRQDIRRRRAGHRRGRLLTGAVGVLVAASGLVVATAPHAVAVGVPVTVSITSIEQIGTDVDPGITQGPIGDFYAGVTINGVQQDNFANRLDYGFELGVGYIFPYRIPLNPPWSFTQTVDSSLNTVSLSIELWDNDDCDHPFCDDTGIFENNDDQVDISPTGSETLSLALNLQNAAWSGDVAFPQSCVAGTGGEAVRICFDVNTISASQDTDGDSLLDAWEQHGYNGDGDGTIDVNLPALGADPRRKDIFVEIDCLVADTNADGDTNDPGEHTHCPAQAAMTPVVQSFANAPVANVDGTSGIQLHIDTGTLYGAGTSAVNGTGGVTGTLGNLGGGGTQIPEAGNTVIDYDGAAGSAGTSVYALKATAFDAVHRAGIFRWGLFAHQTNSRQPVNDCTSGQAEDIKGNDFYVTLGGRRDLDGNGTADTTCWSATAADQVDDDGDGRVDEDPADGVDNDGDCVPGTDTNADGIACGGGDVGVDEDGGQSVGSITQQSGTFQHEFGHVLGLQHGGGDGTNNKPNYLSVMNYSFQACSVPASPAAATAPIPGGCDYSRSVVNLNEPSLDECVGLGAPLGFGAVDWNGNRVLQGVTNCVPPNNANVAADISGEGNVTALPGFDDWNGIFYNFQSLADFGDDGAIHPIIDEPDPRTIDDGRRHLSTLTAPDVHVKVTGPATALPGQTLSYTTTAGNDGRGPALQAVLSTTRPDGSVVTSALDALLVGGSATRTSQYQVAPDACPTTLNVTSRVGYQDLAGVRGSASGTTTTQVLDVTPPVLTVAMSPDSLWPPNHKLVPATAQITVTDECDPNPTVRLLSVTSSEADNGTGDGDTTGDIVGASIGTDDRSLQLRAERSGGGSGRTYTLMYEAKDASGNATTRTATVVVAHNR